MRNRYVRGFGIAVLVALAIVLFGFFVMQLWNWLLPPLFGFKAITFLQALALLVLSRILFGGMRGRGMHGGWRSRMRERWDRMTPEEREKFRSGFGRHCRSYGEEESKSAP